jgi:Asp-tRNA(Asn)/Glu-tRNA(Gln) amidotransferase C subunit
MAQQEQKVDLNYSTSSMGIQQVSEDEVGKVAWSSKKIIELMEQIDQGYKPKVTPFYEGNPILRKGNITFEYTEQELQALVRCQSDIVYFANNFCTVMTDEGLQTITLRPYQEEMIKTFKDNRFCVTLASRQIGKCLAPASSVTSEDGNIKLGILYFEELAKTRKLTWLEKIKFFLYKLL